MTYIKKRRTADVYTYSISIGTADLLTSIMLLYTVNVIQKSVFPFLSPGCVIVI